MLHLRHWSHKVAEFYSVLVLALVTYNVGIVGYKCRVTNG